tara:strand:+ start:2244 stop:2417 length:174 start_codon:yes stop_codon:yes gene_type:complete
MKRAFKKDLDLNKSTVGCAPCINEAYKIEKKINGRSLTDIRIEEIKKIVNSLFDDKN